MRFCWRPYGKYSMSVTIRYVIGTAVTLSDGSELTLSDGDAVELGTWTGDLLVSTSDLGDLVYRVGRELNLFEESSATSGSTTSIADTNGRDEADDFFNGGFACIVRDAGGGGAAPEGEYANISDYASGTMTLRETLTAAVGVGDRYAVASPRIPLHVLIQHINTALIDLGKVPYNDITSITTASDQSEYTLPLAASEDLRQVWYQIDDSDSNDNRWSILYNWYTQETSTGTAKKLVFPYQPPEPYLLKLVYVAGHPELYSATDKLSEFVPVDRVIYQAALNCLGWYRKRVYGRTA